MRALPPLCVIFLISLTGSSLATGASILYNLTDLGASYHLEAGANGQLRSVANANGTAAYVFQKSPVISTTTRTTYPDSPSTYYDGLTLQSGSYQVGVIPINGKQFGIFLQPTFEGATFNNWQGPGGSTSPIADINSSGQVVGQSTGGLTGVLNGQILVNTTYAAFTADGMQSHSFNSANVDNLNNYVPPLTNNFLTAAVHIDDSGQIIAQSYNGDNYLLTPSSLGGAQPVPEPATALAWGFVGAGLAVYRHYRRR